MPEMGPDIGATLRETRMRARIDIGEVEMRTKIRAKYLRAIENEEWDLLPGPVYVKSFLRTYAEYLDLDARGLLDEYKRRYELAPDAQNRPLSAVRRDRERERERSARGPRRAPLPSWAIIGLVLVAAGVALYLIGRGHGNPSPKSAQTSPHHGTTPTSPPTPTVTHSVSTTTARTDVRRRATLKLVPTGTVWVCVQNGSGAKLIDGVTEAIGADIPAVSGGTLLVTLGNASITMTANGKPYPLTASSSAIYLKVSPRRVSTIAHGPSCA